MLDIHILGCSGGIGGDLRTTSLLVGQHVLIDAGTGVGDLSLDQLSQIDHIFITHSHLDHVLGIPLIADAVGGIRKKPITIHALEETIVDLKAHIFNWKIWPDFSVLPDLTSPYIQWESIRVGETVTVDNIQIEALPAKHVVPAIGYAVHGKTSSLAFSGDSCYCPEFWHALKEMPQLSFLIVETSFINEDQVVAEASQHFTPQDLTQALLDFDQSIPVYITHLKPGEDQVIMKQFESTKTNLIHRLLRGQVLRLI
jgi:ribonuclease BN (tRNA processing enzyme)